MAHIERNLQDEGAEFFSARLKNSDSLTTLKRPYIKRHRIAARSTRIFSLRCCAGRLRQGKIAVLNNQAAFRGRFRCELMRASSMPSFQAASIRGSRAGGVAWCVETPIRRLMQGGCGKSTIPGKAGSRRGQPGQSGDYLRRSDTKTSNGRLRSSLLFRRRSHRARFAHGA